MKYIFADRVKTLKPSAIREILKYSSDPEVISFSAGNPSPEAFPVAEITEITSAILRDDPVSALQYSITEGYLPLRNQLKSYLHEKHDSFKSFDELIITSGGQQAIELSAKILCNYGDTVLCESPSFVGALNSFRSLGANLVGVPIEKDGIDTEKFEALILQNKNVKLLYTIPNFQNPSGVTMSNEKRREVYRIAQKHGIIILEDNPYGELRYSGENIANIKSFDTDGIVIHVGSFSKLIAPGLRVGYVSAPIALVNKMIVCKQTEDVHTAILSQKICSGFMEKYSLENHIQKIKKIYSEKLDLMSAALDNKLSKFDITHSKVSGGLFLWCKLPSHVSMPDFCLALVKNEKVAVVPGSAFLVDDISSCSHFRMNFSMPTKEEIAIGTDKISAFAEKFI